MNHPLGRVPARTPLLALKSQVQERPSSNLARAQKARIDRRGAYRDVVATKIGTFLRQKAMYHRGDGTRTQWKTLGSTNVIERLDEEFRRWVKTQGSLPSEPAALALFFSRVASGQVRLRRIDGWRTIAAV